MRIFLLSTFTPAKIGEGNQVAPENFILTFIQDGMNCSCRAPDADRVSKINYVSALWGDRKCLDSVFQRLIFRLAKIISNKKSLAKNAAPAVFTKEARLGRQLSQVK